MAGRQRESRTALLLARLEENSGAMAAARAGFDQTADPDLLAYYLYEGNALRARHAYLFRQLRELWRQEEGT